MNLSANDRPLGDEPDSRADGRPRGFIRDRRLLGILPLLVVLAGIALLVAVGQADAGRWNTYPLVTFENVRAYDPVEPLRGAYVDLFIGVGDQNVRQPGARRVSVVRFLAAEADAKTIEGVLRGGTVTLEARRAPDGRLRAVAVITADGRRFEAR